ncbi:MAG: type III-B CRISPR module-associated protein Cmr5 [Actinobacteria bacterium]|nr:type III-B CRISPR module-associated protein Cmr5 [Actinomycetota bacterium]
MPEITIRQKTERERAQYAWEIISRVKHEQYKEKYLSYVKSASSLILTNGLLQTLAFWKAKSNGESNSAFAYSCLLRDINNMVLGESGDFFQLCKDTADLDQYREYTRLSLASLTWLKRFAEAELK